MENNQAQDTMESGGVKVETENKKKWSIPRVSSAPMCYSLYEWAFRLSLSDMILGGGMAGLFFWLTTKVDTTVENYEAGNAALIIFGIIFCVVFCFGLILCIGLWSNKYKVLLRVYCWYASILAVIVFVLFFISAIFLMAKSGEIGTGFLAIFLGVLLAGYCLYIGCVVYTIYMNIIENKEELNLKKGGC